jgi:hypothetical protein
VGGGNIRGYMISEEKGERLRRAQATITGTCNKTPAFAGLSYGVESRDYRGRRDGKILESFLSSFVPFLSLFSWASGFVGGDEIHRLWVFVAPNPWSLDLCDTRDASLRDATRVVFACWQLWLVCGPGQSERGGDGLFAQSMQEEMMMVWLVWFDYVIPLYHTVFTVQTVSAE